MSDWKDVRGYGVGLNPKSSTVTIYLYCSGKLVKAEDNYSWVHTDEWQDTIKYKVDYLPENAAIAIDLLRNEKSIAFNPTTKRLYVYAQEAGINEIRDELTIKT